MNHEQRLVTLEKDVAIMKNDIIYKLDDTNSAVAMLKGIIGNQGQDIKDIKSQVKIINVRLDAIDTRLDGIDMRLDGIDTRLDGIEETIRTMKGQQDRQGQDIAEIKLHLHTFEQRFVSLEDKFEQRFASLEEKFERVLQMVTALAKRIEA